MTKPVPEPIGIAAQIEPAVQVVNDVDQADRVHVEDCRSVGIVAHLRRIAGNADQILDADRCGAQQIALNAEHVAVAASVVQNGIDADLALDQKRKRLIAHARRSPRAVGDIYRVHAHRFQKARAFDLFATSMPFGGTISTMVTNSPWASFAPRRRALSSGRSCDSSRSRLRTRGLSRRGFSRGLRQRARRTS